MIDKEEPPKLFQPQGPPGRKEEVGVWRYECREDTVATTVVETPGPEPGQVPSGVMGGVTGFMKKPWEPPPPGDGC